MSDYEILEIAQNRFTRLVFDADRNYMIPSYDRLVVIFQAGVMLHLKKVSYYNFFKIAQNCLTRTIFTLGMNMTLSYTIMELFGVILQMK